jgi:hypothetical protein
MALYTVVLISGKEDTVRAHDYRKTDTHYLFVDAKNKEVLSLPIAHVDYVKLEQSNEEEGMVY